MCFKPTREETARSEARRAGRVPETAAEWREHREDPSANTEPRGNGEVERDEIERGSEKLETVLAH